jgi:Mrp family chromosome partitioning ATPase
MTSARPASVIAVASGTGGVGQTNAAVDLSVALDRVGLLDADFGRRLAEVPPCA